MKCQFCGTDATKTPSLQSSTGTICIDCLATCNRFLLSLVESGDMTVATYDAILSFNEMPVSIFEELMRSVGSNLTEHISAEVNDKYGYLLDEKNSRIGDAENQQHREVNTQFLTPKRIKEHLDEYVIGQEQAKKVLSVAVYNHYNRIKTKGLINNVEVQKSNILLYGPTGCGKTLLVQTLAKLLDVPFAANDATALTEAGYVGDDVENILTRLLQAADGDIEKAQRGIVYIDEVDKISRRSENRSITRDVSGEGVQQALLKIIEGAVVNVPVARGRKHPLGGNVEIDTSNILFICSGAFDGLDKIIEERTKENRMIGFSDTCETKELSSNKQSTKAINRDFVHYGLIPELLGRLPVIVGINQLNVEDLVRVVSEPKNSVIKQYQALLKQDGVNLQFDAEAIKKIAQTAIDSGTGARGIRSILEDTLLDLMYNIEDIRASTINIDENYITTHCKVIS